MGDKLRCFGQHTDFQSKELDPDCGTYFSGMSQFVILKSCKLSGRIASPVAILQTFLDTCDFVMHDQRRYRSKLSKRASKK